MSLDRFPRRPAGRRERPNAEGKRSRRRLLLLLLLVVVVSTDRSCAIAKLDSFWAVGEWWQADTEVVVKQALQTGGGPNVSDAHTINGLPGPLYNCSAKGTVSFSIFVFWRGRSYCVSVLRSFKARTSRHLSKYKNTKRNKNKETALMNETKSLAGSAN